MTEEIKSKAAERKIMEGKGLDDKACRRAAGRQQRRPEPKAETKPWEANKRHEQEPIKLLVFEPPRPRSVTAVEIPTPPNLVLLRVST